jgi:serine/threonine protein kinase
VRRALLAWHVAHRVFFSLDEMHETGIVHDEINLDTILVQPQKLRWGYELWGSGLRRTMRAYSDVRHFDNFYAPNIYLRGFALNRLLENGDLDEAHAAPARVAGAAATAASDVYSLGVVLHELLSGRRQQPGRSPENLEHLGHGAPRLVAALVMRMLEPRAHCHSIRGSDWAQAFQEAFLSAPNSKTGKWMGPIIWHFPELERERRMDRSSEGPRTQRRKMA